MEAAPTRRGCHLTIRHMPLRIPSGCTIEMSSDIVQAYLQHNNIWLELETLVREEMAFLTCVIARNAGVEGHDVQIRSPLVQNVHGLLTKRHLFGKAIPERQRVAYEQDSAAAVDVSDRPRFSHAESIPICSRFGLDGTLR